MHRSVSNPRVLLKFVYLFMLLSCGGATCAVERGAAQNTCIEETDTNDLHGQQVDLRLFGT